MQIDLPNSGSDKLKVLYSQTEDRLKSALLNGDAWEEVRELRHRLTDLEAAIYQRDGEECIHPESRDRHSTGKDRSAKT